MNLLRSLGFICLFSISVASGSGQLVQIEDFGTRWVSGVIFEKNWRTRDHILLAELEFSPGEEIGRADLEKSLRKIWNLGNFAEVSYRWDTLPGGGHLLYIAARDAITLSPIISGWTSRSSGALKLGLEDRNLLGRNIRFEGRLQLGEPVIGALKLTIPRQLLYRNMALTAAILDERLRIPEWKPRSDEGATTIPLEIRSREVLVRVGNPYHKDFSYRFSPDFQLSYAQSSSFKFEPAKTGTRDYDPASILFVADWLEVRFIEQLGTLTRRLHQEEGSQLLIEAAAGVSLSETYDQSWALVTGEPLSSRYFSLSGSAESHSILAPQWQSSLRIGFHACNSRSPGHWNHYDGSQVTGLLPGKLTFPVNGNGYAGIHYTWFSHPWLTLEQNLFALYAFGLQEFSSQASATRHYAVGTGFEITSPMYPKAGLRVSLFYSGRGNPWYFFEL